MSDVPAPTPYLQLTADIVAAFVGKNHIPAAELPALIEIINASLGGLANPKAVEPVAEKPQPAVPIRKSVNDDFIICLEDGKKFKSLKRHLQTSYDMTPDQYRAKWGLSSDYPMVAPAYAAQRSKLAKALGLGQLRQKAAAAAVEPPSPPPPPAPIATPARRPGRPRKSVSAS